MPFFTLANLRVILCGWLMLIQLTACNSLSESLSAPFEPRYPTIGPVEGRGGVAELLLFELSATTNCALVGDVVRFTLVVTSLSDEPVRLTSDPLLEMTLSPARWPFEDPVPLQFWSETAQYPLQIDPVLQPGERWIYSNITSRSSTCGRSNRLSSTWLENLPKKPQTAITV